MGGGGEAFSQRLSGFTSTAKSSPLLKFVGTNRGRFSSAGLTKGRHRKDPEEEWRMDGGNCIK
jgi:hypothetical protein